MTVAPRRSNLSQRFLFFGKTKTVHTLLLRRFPKCVYSTAAATETTTTTRKYVYMYTCKVCRGDRKKVDEITYARRVCELGLL